jgi:hypothetical protein
LHDLRGGTVNLPSRQSKKERGEVFSVEVTTLVYLDWSDHTITFDRDDHPDYIPNPRKYPLVVYPIIGNTRLTKVLMDGGISLSIIYADTLDLLGVGRSQIRPRAMPFHGITPGKRVHPLGQIDLPVCFRTPTNFLKETLTFEVVGFQGTYHAVLGQPCYAKFMAVLNYMYLKLKMTRPTGVITIGPTYHHDYECNVDYIEYATVLVNSEALIADLENLAGEVPDAKKHTGNFEPAEATKTIPLDPSGSGEKVL